MLVATPRLPELLAMADTHMGLTHNTATAHTQCMQQPVGHVPDSPCTGRSRSMTDRDDSERCAEMLKYTCTPYRAARLQIV